MNRRLTAMDYVAVTALFCLVIILAGARLVPGVVGLGHDDGIYVSSAQGLARGSGYRLMTLPGQPLQTKYPPLYPLLLAVFWILFPSFPGNVVYMDVATLTCGAAAIAASYAYLVRFNYAPRPFAGGACLLAATAPYVLFMYSRPFSEGTFSLLIVAALWSLERHKDREDHAGIGLGGVLIALSCLCRLFGVTAMLASVAWLIRDRRRLAIAVTPSILTIGGWFAWIHFTTSNPLRNSAGLYYTDYSSAIIGHETMRGLFANFIRLMFDSSGVFDVNRTWPFGPGPFLVVVASSLAAWVAIVVGAFRSWRLLNLFLICYCALIVLWPWIPGRFIVPIIPLLSAAILCALARFAGRRAWLRWLVTATIGLSVSISSVANIRAAIDISRAAKATGYPYELTDLRMQQKSMFGLYTWASYERTFDWISEHTDRHDIIAAMLDPMVSLYTQRPAIRPIRYIPEAMYGPTGHRGGSAQEVRQILTDDRARFIVLMPSLLEDDFENAFKEIRDKDPSFAVEVFADSDPRFQVWRVE